MTTVTIHELTGEQQSWTSRHRTADHATAIQAAIAKRFGKHAFLWRDAGLLRAGYGQICVPDHSSDGRRYRCITGRVRIDAD